jgi:hypothetical protein
MNFSDTKKFAAILSDFVNVLWKFLSTRLTNLHKPKKVKATRDLLQNYNYISLINVPNTDK